jgi:peroxiredoxin Q/BCP
VAGAAPAADLAPGAQAPDFALAGSDGKQHKLADHVGKRGIVLAWFPKAFTPG